MRNKAGFCKIRDLVDVYKRQAANNAPLVIRNGEVIELGYDKLPVGLGELEGDFTDFKFQLQPNDMLYLFTDGYADQFGGRCV